jgi:hypothetical protein
MDIVRRHLNVCRISLEDPNLSALILDGSEMRVSGSSIEALARSPSALAEESIQFRQQPTEKRTGRLALCATYENLSQAPIVLPLLCFGHLNLSQTCSPFRVRSSRIDWRLSGLSAHVARRTSIGAVRMHSIVWALRPSQPSDLSSETPCTNLAPSSPRGGRWRVIGGSGGTQFPLTSAGGDVKAGSRSMQLASGTG